MASMYSFGSGGQWPSPRKARKSPGGVTPGSRWQPWVSHLGKEPVLPLLAPEHISDRPALPRLSWVRGEGGVSGPREGRLLDPVATAAHGGALAAVPSRPCTGWMFCIVRTRAVSLAGEGWVHPADAMTVVLWPHGRAPLCSAHSKSRAGTGMVRVAVPRRWCRESAGDRPTAWGQHRAGGGGGAGQRVLRWPRLAAPQRALSQTPVAGAPQGRGAALPGFVPPEGWPGPGQLPGGRQARQAEQLTGQAWSMPYTCGSGQSRHCPGQACGSPAVHSPGAGVVVVATVEGWGTQGSMSLVHQWPGARGCQAWGASCFSLSQPCPGPLHGLERLRPSWALGPEGEAGECPGTEGRPPGAAAGAGTQPPRRPSGLRLRGPGEGSLALGRKHSGGTEAWAGQDSTSR